MTQKDLLLELLRKGIIVEIGGEYAFTSKYEKLINDAAVVEEIKDAAYLRRVEVPITAADMYPPEVINVRPALLVPAMMDYCGVPKKGKYLLRSYDKNTTKTIKKLVNDVNIKPDILLKAITEYYKHIEYPKSFKNFVADNDIIAMYDLYASGDSLASTTTDDSTWK